MHGTLERGKTKWYGDHERFQDPHAHFPPEFGAPDESYDDEDSDDSIEQIV